MLDLKTWVLASRPWSFSMSAISVTVGAALAAGRAPFSWGLYLLTLVGIVLLHAATNLINDYYDVRSGVDRLDVSTARYRPHPLVEGRIRPEAVLRLSWSLYALAALVGIYLAATRGWAILLLGLAGALASLLYTAPPLKYKYVALGEASVLLMWGPLMVEGAYYVQAQGLSAQAFWVSLPFGVLVSLVLLANNLRDVEHDAREGIRTLPIVLGRQNALRLYVILVGLAYLGILALIVLSVLPPWALLVFASLPLALRLMRTLAHEVPQDADARTAQLDNAFGVLLVLALLLERLF